MDWRFIVSLIFAIIIAFFAVLNAGVADINLLFTTVTISQALIILISATIGALIVVLMNLLRRIKTGNRIKALEKENTILIATQKELEEELQAIKATEEDINLEEVMLMKEDFYNNDEATQ